MYLNKVNAYLKTAKPEKKSASFDQFEKPFSSYNYDDLIVIIFFSSLIKTSLIKLIFHDAIAR